LSRIRRETLLGENDGKNGDKGRDWKTGTDLVNGSPRGGMPYSESRAYKKSFKEDAIDGEGKRGDVMLWRADGFLKKTPSGAGEPPRTV